MNLQSLNTVVYNFLYRFRILKTNDLIILVPTDHTMCYVFIKVISISVFPFMIPSILIVKIKSE